jgi:peptidoglycan/xylan/chitin deacetylase (PgdA/CDA1 family)
MLDNTILLGSTLPPKTVCLTFDDGPGKPIYKNIGPKTLEVAVYLHSEGIVATFFMVGKFIKKYPGIVKQVKELGHIIGHHTTNHPDMNSAFSKGKNLLPELLETEHLIKDYISNNTIYFRPPFGRWNKEMSIQLNNGLNSNFNYIGPIGWHIDGSDWWFWSKFDKDAAEKCAEHYLKLIRAHEKGIILMHDSSANRYFWAPIRKWNNKTLETLKIVVKALKEEGYSFVGLDQISFDGSN